MARCTILLASASPRRRELLEALGHRVIVHPVNVDETERPREAPDDYLARVVDAKLAAASELTVFHPFDALLVADTAVEVEGRILHKPVDDADGRRMLRALSSTTHRVTTRFALSARSGRLHVESVLTRVSFRRIGAPEIDEYVASGEGRDKAGGYAIQGLGAAFVSRIEGSYGAVVGLPSCEVTLALRAIGAI